MTDPGPEDDGITLLLEDGRGPAVELTKFKEYAFSSNFLTPTDGFTFTMGDEAISKSILESIFIGQQVSLRIGGYVQAGGFIDRMPMKTSRRGGTEITITGRDWLSPAVDAHVDPDTVRFSPQQSLLDILVACFSPYGFGGINQIQADDSANFNVITGQSRGTKTSKTGKPLKAFQLHQLKPWPREGVFEFASRLSQRFGLWIWVSADGLTLFVSEPDFTQKPIYNIVHNQSECTYLEGEIDPNAENQPAIIVATGFGGGGAQGRAGMKVIMVNELLGLVVTVSGSGTTDIMTVGSTAPTDDNASYVQKIIQAHPDATVLPTRPALQGITRLNRAQPRAIYLHDDESKTPEQLEFYVRREMALKQQGAITLKYKFERHTLGDVPWNVNAIANVSDDALNVYGAMWVLERTFMKSRHGGTTTLVKLIVPNTLLFGEG
jgi:prophage tail gpP-like protein